MALPSSGAISLNQMHVEAGGSSGTQCSLNDSDIRGLISKGSGSQMSFSEWYGASSSTTESSLVFTAGNFTLYSANTFHFAGNQQNSQIFWTGTIVVSNSNASYNFHSYLSGSNLASNTPFPAHSGTIGGWRYFGKRGDAGYPFGDDFVSGIDFPANRTTSSSYPF
tara:strand:+ start:31 stop:528 length:498 start_codon:yes stop_codon:yes gene_type:complete